MAVDSKTGERKLHTHATCVVNSCVGMVDGVLLTKLLNLSTCSVNGGDTQVICLVL